MYFLGKLQIVSHDVGDDGKKEICMWGHIFPGHRAATALPQMLLLVSIACISHWLFSHPPHKSYFTICQLFPKALGCPLDILCGFAQANMHLRLVDYISSRVSWLPSPIDIIWFAAAIQSKQTKSHNFLNLPPHKPLIFTGSKRER